MIGVSGNTGAVHPVDFVDKEQVPFFPVNVDEGFHVLALAFDLCPPTIELAGALGAVEVDLVADDDGHTAILTLTVDSDVNLALEGIEAKDLRDLDELKLLFLSELTREAECGEVVE
jgi:hypothetical protein